MAEVARHSGSLAYLILALPRSRTAWLSRFLTYGDWTCGHEELRHMRSLSEVRTYLAKPRNGSAETIAAPGWRLVGKLAPTAKVVVVRRPVADVIDSLMALPVPFDRALITKVVATADRKLDQIEARLPCLSVKFDNLAEESICKALFEYCLPYRHDQDHWKCLDRINVQVDARSFFTHSDTLRSNLDALASVAKIETFRETTTCLQ